MPDVRSVHAPVTGDPLADEAVDAYLAAVGALDPAPLVRKAVRQGWIDAWLGDRLRPRMISVLAVGKAAPRMLWGLVEAGVPFKGLGVAPLGVQAPHVDTFRWLAAEHPVPGPGSFAAGESVLAWAHGLPADEPLLVLLSGGASSLMEAPMGDPRDLQDAWRRLLGEGLPIAEMNRKRATLSRLKAGGLGRVLLDRTSKVECWVLADTPPERAAATVGSGPLWIPGGRDVPPGREGADHVSIPHRVLASNADAVTAAALRLAARGFQVFRHAQRIDGELAAELAGFLDAAHSIPGSPVALVAGGEPTLEVPEGAPAGGRCAHAAALAAGLMAQRGMAGVFLAAATDGVDGTTDAGGAWTKAGDAPKVASSTEAFASHAALDRLRRLVRPGPTGTNANELWMYLGPATA